MLNHKIKELRSKIIEGLRQSSIKMLEEKKKNNEKIAISENGEIKIINASEIK